MSENKKSVVVSALRSMMKPIVLLLLRNGVTYKEFATLCKSIFVEAALEGYGLRGRPTNTSRIAVLTGLDRKEVKRIRDLLDENPELLAAQSAQDRITRVLTAWHQDSEFLDKEGKPSLLSHRGGPGSFESLVRRYGGDVPLQSLQRELERLGLIALEQDQVRVLSRYYFPAQRDPAALLRAGSVINELVSTLNHNLHHADPGNSDLRLRPRFERRASNNLVDPRYRKHFAELLEHEGQAFLERVDTWLSHHEVPPEGPVKPIRMTVGLYCAESTCDDKNKRPGD